MRERGLSAKDTKRCIVMSIDHSSHYFLLASLAPSEPKRQSVQYAAPLGPTAPSGHPHSARISNVPGMSGTLHHYPPVKLDGSAYMANIWSGNDATSFA